MPKIVDVPKLGRVEFPDFMSDDEMSQHVKALMQPDARTGWWTQPIAADEISKFREQHPIASQVALAIPDAVAGIGSGVQSTLQGAYNLARKIPGIDKVLPPVSADLQRATEAPPSLMGHVGKFAEQAGEFALPVGEVNTAVKGIQAARAADLAAAGVKASRFLPAAERIAAESAAAGGVSAVQSGGDPTATALGAGGTALLGGAAAAIPEGAKAAVAKAIANASRPLSAGAIALADRYGIPLTQGDLTGSKFVQGVQKLLSSTVAPDLFEAQAAEAQKGLNSAASDLSGKFSADHFVAGKNTLNALSDAAKQHEAAAQKGYDAIAAFEAHPDNQVTVRVGTKPVTEYASEPVMETMGLPVDMRDTKQALAPIEKEIGLRMPSAQQRADPGLTAVRAILSRPDFLPASVAEADLGYLKDILRSPAPGQAKRLAGAAIDSLDQSVKNAVSQAGPEALDALNSARSNWRQRSEIMELAKDISGLKDPEVAAAKNLLQPGDASFPTLQKVLAAAPEARPQLGESFLTERVFKKASAEGQNFTNPDEARNLWNQIGPRTKAALYTPDQIRDVNDLIDLASRLKENPNPSGTGSINAMLKMGILMTNPIKGIGAISIGRRAAGFLLDPQRASLLRTALEREGTPEGSKALQALQGIVAAAETPRGNQ